MDDWLVERARRVHSLAPLKDLDPFTLPFTRGDLAREVMRLRADPETEESPDLLSLLDELEEELAPELFVPRADRPDGTVPVSVRGEFRLSGESGRRGAGRSVLLGDSSVRLTPRLLWHQRAEIDNRGMEQPDFLGHPWKRGVTGRFTHAYFVYRAPGFALSAGRRRFAWGPGLSGSMLLQGSIPSLDQVGIEWAFGPFSGRAFVAPLDDFVAGEGDEETAARRWLSGRRVVFRPSGGRFHVAFSEAVLYGGEERAFDWGYANPLMSAYAVQWNKSRDDNVLWSFDAYARVHESVDLFGEFLIDDFQYDLETEPNQIGFLAGMRLKDLPRLPGLFVEAEYVRVNNWVYGHGESWNRYTYGNAILGHPIGPDADRILVRLLRRFGRTFELLADYERRREGEGSIDDSRDSAVPHGTGFLTGEVTTHDLPAFEVRWNPRANRRLFARVERSEGEEWIVSGGGMIRFAASHAFDR
ncbi:MAG: capsule assembly Wzi family protein [Candidatus Eisenbacteria bacterium]